MMGAAPGKTTPDNGTHLEVLPSDGPIEPQGKRQPHSSHVVLL